MLSVEEILLLRVAHHEAAHAVLVVACGFRLGETFLTRDATLDGSLGGFTGWANPLDPRKAPNAKSFEIHGDQVAIVLLAGQYAEQQLRDVDPRVLLPKDEPNWRHDDDEARRIVECEAFRGRQNLEVELRARARSNVDKLWPVVAEVALLLQAPIENAAAQVVEGQHPDGRSLVPASRVIRGAEVEALARRSFP